MDGALYLQPGPWRGRPQLPPSKSQQQRLILAELGLALSQGRASIGKSQELLVPPSSSEDVRVFFRAAEDLLAGRDRLDCAENASALRFLLPMAAMAGRELDFCGRPRLLERGWQGHVGPLSRLAYRLEAPSEERLCLRRLGGGSPCPPAPSGSSGTRLCLTLEAQQSSQYFTGWLFALGLSPRPWRLDVAQAVSLPYVELSLTLLRRYGWALRCQRDHRGRLLWLEGPAKAWSQPARPHKLPEIEADASAAACFYLARHLGHPLSLDQPSQLQGDGMIVPFLEYLSSGSEAVPESLGSLVLGRTAEAGLSCSTAQHPDLIFLLAIALAKKPGLHCLSDLHRLRKKESDRVSATVELLAAFGLESWISAEEGRPEEERLWIRGRDFGPRWLGAEGLSQRGALPRIADHRIQMAMAILASMAQRPCAIPEADSVGKSFPQFWTVLEGLGAGIERCERECI